MRRVALIAFVFLGACGPEPEVPCPGGESRDAAGVCLLPCAGIRIEDRCVIAGVPEDGCGDGFAPDGKGGCAALRPETPCGENEMALPGETACRPVMPCGTPPWGELARPAGTLHVLVSADPSLADGSAGAPYATITAALDVAPAGGRIVIGPGVYDETLFPDRPVTLAGLCPAEVTIDGRGAGTALFAELTDDVTVSGMTLVGTDFGAALIDGVGFLLDRVVIHTADMGFMVAYETAPTEGILRNSLVHTVGTGAIGLGGTLRVEDSELRAVKAASANVASVAVMAIPDLDTPVAFVTGSVLQDVFGYGIAVNGGPLTVTDTLIQRVTAFTADDGGVGIASLFETNPPVTAEATITGSVIQDAAVGGIYGETQALRIERTTITGIRDVEGIGDGGVCFSVANPDGTRGATVSLTEVYLGDCDLGGLYVSDADLSVTRTLIEDPGVLAQRGGYGHGIVVFSAPDGGSQAHLTDVVIDRPREVGVFVFGSRVEATGLVVRDATATDAYGDGISVSADIAPDGTTILPASFVGDHLLVEKSERAGISAFGADLTLSKSHLLCNGLDLNTTETFGASNLGVPVSRPATVSDAGDNTCGCGETPGACRAEAENLAPAPPPELPARPGL